MCEITKKKPPKKTKICSLILWSVLNFNFFFFIFTLCLLFCVVVEITPLFFLVELKQNKKTTQQQKAYAKLNWQNYMYVCGVFVLSSIVFRWVSGLTSLRLVDFFSNFKGIFFSCNLFFFFFFLYLCVVCIWHSNHNAR